LPFLLYPTRLPGKAPADWRPRLLIAEFLDDID
jgi:hypothetical protein